MMAEIVDLQVVTRLDIPAHKIIKRASEADLTEIVIVGFDAAGDLFFASNKGDAGTVIFHLEMAKKRLLDICDGDEA